MDGQNNINIPISNNFSMDICHNRSTRDILKTNNILHNSISANSKYKRFTIINNTINYNTFIHSLPFKEASNTKSLNLSVPSKQIINDDANDNYIDDNIPFDLNKSLSPSEEKNKIIEIADLKNNLDNSNYFKEVSQVQDAKSVSSREKEINNTKNNYIINVENMIVNIDEISSSNNQSKSKTENKNEKKLISNNENKKLKINDNTEYNNININSKEKMILNRKEDTNTDLKKNTEYCFDIINYKSPNKNIDLVKKYNTLSNKKKSKGNYNNDYGENIINLYGINISNNNNEVLIFFIDGQSDNEDAKKLLNMGLKYSIMQVNSNLVSIYLLDMSDTNSINENIEILLLESKLHKFIKVILCCGDEMIYPFISKLSTFQDIDFTKIIFGALPFGRTNDLSIQFGFGDSINFSSNFLNKLKEIIHDIIEATCVNIDIWEIKICFDENRGGYIELDKNLNKNEIRTPIYRRGFISYFSLGYDSRIGFNMLKTKQKFCKISNFCKFWWEAVKKICLKNIKLKGFIDALYYINLPKNDDNENSINENNQTLKEDNGRKITIFQTCDNNDISINENNNSLNQQRVVKTDLDIDEDKNTHEHGCEESESEYEKIDETLKTFKYEKIIIKGEPLGLICQNIKYFFDGNASKWDTKNPSYGIQTKKNTKLSNKSEKNVKKEKEEKDTELFNKTFKSSIQKINDHKLEFFSYSTIKEIKSKKKERIYNGEGPFKIQFKEILSNVSILII